MFRLELAMARAALASGLPIPPAAEVTGRGYKRVPTDPMAFVRPDITVWYNQLPIVWPQAKADWGQVTYLGLTLPDDNGKVAASYPVTLIVRAGDQPRIAAGGLEVRGVGPNTSRPYGIGRYSLSLFGLFPSGGQIWGFTALLGWAWQQQANDCAPWPSSPAIVAGGCAA